VNPTGHPGQWIGVGSRLPTAGCGTGSPANGADTVLARVWAELRTVPHQRDPRNLLRVFARGIGHRRRRPAEEADPCGRSSLGTVFRSRGRLTSLGFYLKSKRRLGQCSAGYKLGRAAVRGMPASRSAGGAHGVLADSPL
jgi:hypothetical protein